MFFYIICFNAYNQPNVISDLNNNFVGSLLEFPFLEARWEDWEVGEAALIHRSSSEAA